MVKVFRLIGERLRARQVGDALLGGAQAGAAPDRSRLILWLPVAMGVGAVAYFSWPYEPDPARFALISVILLILCLTLTRLCLKGLGGAWALYGVCLTVGVLLGFGMAISRTQSLEPPELSAFATERTADVTGWIESIDRVQGRARAIVRIQQLEHAELPPYRIRVRMGIDGFEPGDGVRFRARLQPLGGPIASGGYDPARAAWFDRIALTGFSISQTDPAVLSENDRFARGLARLRWRMAETIRASMGEGTGAVAAALLTGERAFVASEDAEALRVSGLGHILAISGLHMALFAGGAYWVARLLIASIDSYARARDPRKPAALLALLAATAYLVLSGGAVSTQRAYVMALVVLLGVVFNRRAFSMRSLALAALVVLVLAPESVIEPGFQMSFAAVAALIASYDVMQRWQQPRSRVSKGIVTKVLNAITGLSATSLIAGAATGAFAAFHFQRMAIYGLIANLAAMPIFTFWVMPAGGVAVILIPFGLEEAALWIMDQGLGHVLAIAHWTSGLQGAALGVSATPQPVLAVYGFGFALCMIGLGRARVLGAAIMVLAMGLTLRVQPPDLMVTDDGVVVARFEGEAGYQATPSRRDRFETGVFFQRLGLSQTERTRLQCDELSCVGRTEDGLLVALTDSPEALATDCILADIVIYQGDASAWRTRRCAAILLDNAARDRLGGSEFWIEGGEVIRLRSALSARRARIWAQPL